MLLDPTTLLWAAAGLTGVGALTTALYRWTAFGLVLFVVAQIHQSFQESGAAGPDVRDTGVDVLPTDVVAVCLLAAAVLRIVHAARRSDADGAPLRPVVAAPLLLLVAMTAWSLLNGGILFGLPTAGNEARTGFVHLLSAALYVAVLPPGTALVRTVTRLWAATAGVLAVFAVLWWLRVGIGSNSDRVMVDGVLTDARALGPEQALLIGQAAVALLCLGGRARAAAWPLLVAVVLMQHRTAWVATGVMAAGWLLSRRGRGGSRGTAVALLACGVALLLPVAAYGGDVAESLASSGEDDRTLMWRVDGWLGLLPQLGGVQDWLLGLPFGSGYARLVDGGLVSVSPHNYYLQVLLRLGLVGLAALLTLYVAVWRTTGPGVAGPVMAPATASAPAEPDADDRARLLLRLLLCSQLVFCITYPLFPEQAVVLGLLAAHARPLGRAVSRTPKEFPCPGRPLSSPESPVRTART
ncbi:O-antigen ligase family protein [Streptomyces sp. NPDC005181]|uniref:O-antigen ligase family protein n=1 Tax=Streptomyces sp. NPDC005181 TaxID=3156869 RepID=UPI0033A6E1D2